MTRWTCAFLLLFAGCSTSRDLTADQRAKLDGRLQMVLDDTSKKAPDEIDTSVRPDGVRVYAVVIHGSDTDQLRKEGISAVGGIGAICTARVTLEELKTLARITAVRSIEAARFVHPNK